MSRQERRKPAAERDRRFRLCAARPALRLRYFEPEAAPRLWSAPPDAPATKFESGFALPIACLRRREQKCDRRHPKTAPVSFPGTAAAREFYLRPQLAALALAHRSNLRGSVETALTKPSTDTARHWPACRAWRGPAGLCHFEFAGVAVSPCDCAQPDYSAIRGGRRFAE